MRVGAQGINLHARQYAVNDPFTFDAAGLHTHPLLYGLILLHAPLDPVPSCCRSTCVRRDSRM